MKRNALILTAAFLIAAVTSIGMRASAAEPTQVAVVPDPTTVEEIGIKFAEASSVLIAALGGHPKDFFGPRKVLDNDWTTCWSEGKDGPGSQEWIKLVWLSKETPAYVAVLPGWAKNKVRWENNSRLRNAEIVLSNGLITQATFEDRMQMQFVKLQNDQPAEWVKIVIRSVYDGYKFQDTSISEIKVYKIKPPPN